ncbi:hypothetical protein SAMN05444280_1052 [Tangfeifania diversioriginum]|uniref:Uncharacterized protein n=1 Tax=Tangfeifania diversioriginum TaxID=1168035 RepID=A0A1M6DD50_9BACT|nr:hypothetical protein SAMN05444280_1052 [Tangfeifania diversioriginum]
MGNAFILTFFQSWLIRINQNKYRHHVKNPAAPTHFLLKKNLAGVVLVIFVLSTTSCKTCKCPAYSQNVTNQSGFCFLDNGGKKPQKIAPTFKGCLKTG